MKGRRPPVTLFVAALVLVVLALGSQLIWGDRNAAVTGLAAIAGVLVAAIITGIQADRQRLEAHKGAVVAVLMELGANVVVSEKAGAAWSLRGLAWRWSHSVHDQMAMSLYSAELPFPVAWKVGNAYAAMRSVKRPDDSAVGEFKAAYQALFAHAKSLGLLEHVNVSDVGFASIGKSSSK